MLRKMQFILVDLITDKCRGRFKRRLYFSLMIKIFSLINIRNVEYKFSIINTISSKNANNTYL